jgi:hypothetical protein
MEESTATLEEVSDQIRNQVLGAKQNQVYTEKVAELAERYGKEVK